MSEKLIDPARPPLPTAWNFPFQSTVGIQTSKRIAGVMTPLTRQIGRAMLPTGAGFWPAGSDSTSMMLVSGKLRSAKVLMVHGALAAAAGAGASETVTIRAVERRKRKKRRLIRHLLLFVGRLRVLLREQHTRPILFSNDGHWLSLWRMSSK